MDKTINILDKNLDDSVNILFNMLDEALDDYENGQLLTKDEFWKGILSDTKKASF